LVGIYFRSNSIDEGSLECSQLLGLLRGMLDFRVNCDHVPPSDEVDFSEFKPFQDKFPDIYRLLCREARFCQKSELGLFKLGTGEAFASGLRCTTSGRFILQDRA